MLLTAEPNPTQASSDPSHFLGSGKELHSYFCSSFLTIALWGERNFPNEEMEASSTQQRGKTNDAGFVFPEGSSCSCCIHHSEQALECQLCARENRMHKSFLVSHNLKLLKYCGGFVHPGTSSKPGDAISQGPKTWQGTKQCHFSALNRNVASPQEKHLTILFIMDKVLCCWWMSVF